MARDHCDSSKWEFPMCTPHICWHRLPERPKSTRTPKQIFVNLLPAMSCHSRLTTAPARWSSNSAANDNHPWGISELMLCTWVAALSDYNEISAGGISIFQKSGSQILDSALWQNQSSQPHLSSHAQHTSVAINTQPRRLLPM